MATAAVDGCNVRAVNNASLIPTLLNYGSLPTPETLLVLITSNVSLGFGLKPGAIPVHRPVVMVGAYSVPTSIDMYMVVNQLNVTSKYSKVHFLSLFIENAAPGDAISSLLSRPMSSAVSANVYAVYCDRLKNCLNLHNSTVVLASQQEMDYLNYMYSMFNSPLPNMRQATAFYHTELRCVVIQMGPGPNGVGMTLYNLTCGAWDLYNSVFTTQPAVAERMPFPEGSPQITAATKAGPLVQSVRDCSSLQEAMKFETVETRLHVWMLLGNIDLVPENDPKCWRNRSIRYPTQIYGAPYDETSRTTFSFAFGYLRDALVPPATADNRFLSIMNTTLTELPQGPDPRAAPPAGRVAPDVLTMLLWSVGRSMAAVDALYLQDVSVWLPRPEFDFFAERAAASSSFVVQLMGVDDLSLKGTTAANDVVRIQTLDGPGMMGSGIELRPMQAGQLPPDYFWPDIPADSFTAATGQGLAGGQVAGIVLGSIFGVLGIMAATYVAWRARHRKHHQHLLLPAKPLDTHSQSSSGPGASCRSCGHNSNHNSNCNSQVDTPKPLLDPSAGGFTVVAVDVASPRDVLPPLPNGPVVQNHNCVGSDAQPAAGPPSGGLGSSGTNGSANVGSLPPSQGAASSSAARSSSSDSISLGLDRWKAAISTTTMQLMERRMQMTSTSCSSSSLRASPGGSSRLNRPNSGSSRGQSGAAAGGSSSSKQQQGLQIHQLIGQGSFGSVWLGTWHNKRVAIKIMQLPASCPFASGQEEPQPAALMAQNQANSPPHMAIMEAVLSSTVSHPNVVQVYTYMVNPLGVGGNGNGSQHRGSPAAGGPVAPSAGVVLADTGRSQQQSFSKITGWELRIVMEYCNSGTLREALDRRMLHGTGVKYLPRESIVCLCHDIAAALLHLHSQGVIHGDLKAANVMLTQGGDDQEGVWAPTFGHRVTAKVADFGLALPLDPSDTHATLAARGTPTHMSPELFMSGHVSKASDVYALGILLHELVSGHRAYQGVPIPLLPHEVAVKGLRPKWPTGLPEEYRDLQLLAEACWQQQPQDRPTITDIFDVLCLMVKGESVSHMLPQYLQGQPGSQEQQEDVQHQQQQQQQFIPDLDVVHSPPKAQASKQAADAASPSQAAGQQSAAAGNGPHTAGRRNMSWSEVSPAGLR